MSSALRILLVDDNAMNVDSQLPGLDGYALYRSLRTSGIERLILALSSAAMPEHVRRGVEAAIRRHGSPA